MFTKKNLRQKMMNFMKERYGRNDLLNRHMLFIGIILLLVSPFIKWKYFVLVPLIVFLLIYSRMLSKNITRRDAENKKYCRFLKPLLFKWTQFKNRKDFIYITCDSCQQKLRVPKHRGTIKITCPNCKHQQKVQT
ncbi:hypothetical protein CBF37_04840 [Vagococcus vulneris]|uniref:Zn-finger containing protein n=1 Tax=Vagococcus vulneris TaxID=1977869 RepID=A0A429ZZ50_9ENTE|nr:hypothetical protein CBF37_04840 [Vagococcus vulneris]